MDLDKIGYFFKAAELGNFTKAAEECHIAQTTMSKYIHVLEQELGCPLFVRNHHQAKLTARGLQFYDGMKSIYEQYRSLCQELHRNRSQELRIGMITTDYVDFPVLRSFEQQYPGYSVYFSFGSEEKLEEDLTCGRVDALICSDILKAGERLSQKLKVGKIPVLSARTVIVCSAELLSRLKSVEKVIESQPLVTKTGDRAYHDFCRQELWKIYGTTFSDVITVKGFSQQLLMVNMANGFAIIPERSHIEGGNMEVFPLPSEFNEVSELLYPVSNSPEPLEKLIRFIEERGQDSFPEP